MPKRSPLRLRRNQKVRGINLRKLLLCILIPSFLVMFLALVIKLIFLPSLWDDKYQFSFSYPVSDGVVISILNPVTDSATNVFIPENTQMQVANKLGSWRLGSVWQLGKQEKVGGYLLSRSLTKTFFVPVDAWASETIKDYDGALWSRLQAIFLTSDTNIKFKDKLKIWLFMLGMPKGNSQTLALAETNSLSLEKLPDGSDGFVPNALTDRVERLFFVDVVSQENARLGITNVANSSGTTNMLVKILETMGTSPVVIREGDFIDGFLCAIYTDASASYTAKKMALVFDCPIKEKRSENNLDIEFVYGEEFVERF